MQVAGEQHFHPRPRGPQGSMPGHPLHHCCRRQEAQAEIARVKDFLIRGETDTLDWVSGEDIGGLSDQEDSQ